MHRDKVLYHFSEEADITYCGGFNASIFHYPHAAFAASRYYSGEGQDSLSLALRENGNSVMARDRPSPDGASRDYNGEGQASLSLALR